MLQGGLYANKPGEQPPSLKARRAAAKALSTSGNSIFRSFTSVCGREMGEGGTLLQLLLGVLCGRACML